MLLLQNTLDKYHYWYWYCKSIPLNIGGQTISEILLLRSPGSHQICWQGHVGKARSLTITQSAVHKTLIVIIKSLVRLEGPQLCPPVSLDWNIPLLQRAYNFFDTHPNSHRAAWKEENASWLPAIHLATQQKWNVGLCNQRIYNILFQWPRKEAVAALCLNTPLRGEKRVSYPWVEFVPFLCPQKCACHVSSSTL